MVISAELGAVPERMIELRTVYTWWTCNQGMRESTYWRALNYRACSADNNYVQLMSALLRSLNSLALKSALPRQLLCYVLWEQFILLLLCPLRSRIPMSTYWQLSPGHSQPGAGMGPAPFGVSYFQIPGFTLDVVKTHRWMW